MADNESTYPFEAVKEAIERRFDEDPSLAIVVLPTCPRLDGLYYSEFDSSVLQAARGDGIEGVAYLHDYAERRHLHEYSAGWLLVIAVGIPANLGADAVLLFVRYVWSQIKNARSKGLIDQGVAPDLRVTAASVKRTAAGDLELKDLVIEGKSAAAVTAVVSAFAPEHLEAALRELDELESTDQQDLDS